MQLKKQEADFLNWSLKSVTILDFIVMAKQIHSDGITAIAIK